MPARGPERMPGHVMAVGVPSVSPCRGRFVHVARSVHTRASTLNQNLLGALLLHTGRDVQRFSTLHTPLSRRSLLAQVLDERHPLAALVSCLTAPRLHTSGASGTEGGGRRGQGAGEGSNAVRWHRTVAGDACLSCRL